MIRNYALTLAGVTLRVYLGIGVAIMAAVPSLTFDALQTTTAWPSFAPNLMIAEWFIVQRTLQARSRRSTQPEPVAA